MMDGLCHRRLTACDDARRVACGMRIVPQLLRIALRPSPSMFADRLPIADRPCVAARPESGTRIARAVAGGHGGSAGPRRVGTVGDGGRNGSDGHGLMHGHRMRVPVVPRLTDFAAVARQPYRNGDQHADDHQRDDHGSDGEDGEHRIERKPHDNAPRFAVEPASSPVAPVYGGRPVDVRPHLRRAGVRMNGYRIRGDSHDNHRRNNVCDPRTWKTSPPVIEVGLFRSDSRDAVRKAMVMVCVVLVTRWI